MNAFDDASCGGRAGLLLALVGSVNLLIIKFSVDWWNTLHQPASVLRLGGPSIDASMLIPLLVMAVGFALLFGWLLLLRMRTALNERKARALRLYGVPEKYMPPEVADALKKSGRWQEGSMPAGKPAALPARAP